MDRRPRPRGPRGRVRRRVSAVTGIEEQTREQQGRKHRDTPGPRCPGCSLVARHRPGRGGGAGAGRAGRRDRLERDRAGCDPHLPQRADPRPRRRDRADHGRGRRRGDPDPVRSADPADAAVRAVHAPGGARAAARAGRRRAAHRGAARCGLRPGHVHAGLCDRAGGAGELRTQHGRLPGGDLRRGLRGDGRARGRPGRAAVVAAARADAVRARGARARAAARPLRGHRARGPDRRDRPAVDGSRGDHGDAAAVRAGAGLPVRRPRPRHRGRAGADPRAARAAAPARGVGADGAARRHGGRGHLDRHLPRRGGDRGAARAADPRRTARPRRLPGVDLGPDGAARRAGGARRGAPDPGPGRVRAA